MDQTKCNMERHRKIYGTEYSQTQRKHAVKGKVWSVGLAGERWLVPSCKHTGNKDRKRHGRINNFVTRNVPVKAKAQGCYLGTWKDRQPNATQNTQSCNKKVKIKTPVK